jgi:hypothetical protein
MACCIKTSMSRRANREKKNPKYRAHTLWSRHKQLLKICTKSRLHILHNNREIIITMHSHNSRLSSTAQLMLTFQRIWPFNPRHLGDIFSHYCVHKRPPLVPEPRQMNIEYLPTTYSWINFNIILIYAGAGSWTLRKVDQKHLESFEMWYWRRMEISWTGRVRNEEVLQRVSEERNILQTVKWRKTKWIGHILRRNCLLKHVIEGKIEGRIDGMARRGRRCKQLLDDLNEKGGCWKLK